MADNTINGTSGDDLLQTPNDGQTNEVYGGDGNDFLVDSGNANNMDSFYGGAGNDEILGGSGNDIIDGGTGNDNATGSDGDDTFVLNDGFGEDSLTGGEFTETTGDVLDASGMTDDATLTFGVDIETVGGGGPPGGGGPEGPGGGPEGPGGGPEDPGPEDPTGETTRVGATLAAGPANLAEILEVESYILGAGNDTVIDDGDDHIVNMGAGDDQYIITDGFGADTVTGGNGGETIGDAIEGSAITGDVIVNFTGDGVGTFTDGIDTLTFDEIERAITGAGTDTIFGGIGADSINANAGDDVFFFGDNFGDDFFRGGEGGETAGDRLDGAALTTDVIVTYTGDTATLSDGTSTMGFAEVETLILGSGHDTVTGDTGNESLFAGAGDDTFAVIDNFGTDTVDLGSGTNSIDGSGLTDVATVVFTADGVGTLTSGANTVNFTGANSASTGAGNDDFISTSLNETIGSNAGDDTFTVADGFGTDAWDAGEGGEVTGDRLIADTLSGDTNVTFNNDGSGSLTDGSSTLSFQDVERVETGAGNDTITGSTDDQSIAAGDGDDTFFITDNFGNDVLEAGTGGETSGDRLDATAMSGGANVVLSDSQSGTIADGAGTATFSGFEEIALGSGNDTVTGSSDSDDILTNGGDDRFVLNDGFGTDTLNMGAGGESIGDTLDGSNLTGAASVSFSGAEQGTLTSGLDTATFTEVERVSTGAGNDTITSGAGNDTVSTNAGDDIYTVANNFGTDSFDAGEGGETDGDRIDASALTASSTIVFNNDGSGSLSNSSNTLSFQDVENIETGAGADTISGSTNNETIVSNGGNDVFGISDDFGIDSFDAGSGTDRVDGSTLSTDTTVNFDGTSSGTLSTSGDVLTFESIEEMRLGSGNDTITGSQADQSILAGAGNDTFIVSDNFGTDQYIAGTGSDTLDASALTGDVTLNFTATEDGTLAADGAQVTFDNVENIITGSGNDTVIGLNGNDTLNTGGGDDTVFLATGFGDYTFDAGNTGETAGDTINASGISFDITADLAGNLTAGSDSLTFSSVENLVTGSGNDDITGTSANETVFSTTGDDTFRIGDGFGNDRFVAGEGGIINGDTLDASALTTDAQVVFSADEAGNLTSGANTLSFQNVEVVRTGSGNDQISGSTNNDFVVTNAGDDSIDTGAGRDTIFAGSGDDEIKIAQGDSVSAGSGDDTFIVENTGEFTTTSINIDGGSEDSATGDRLDLNGLADMSTLSTTDDGSGSLSGSVQLLNGATLNFTDIEDIIPNVICFTPGTMITTPHGPRDIAKLRVGDMVRTRDNGVQPIRWIQRRTVPATDRFAPIRIRNGAFDGLNSDLLISPQHRMLVTGYRAQMLFGESEVLVSAAHLVNGTNITQDVGGDVTYIHMMFDSHEVVKANGALSESFHPGSVGLTAVSDAAREELFSLFPTLRSDPNGYGQTARRCLRQHESRLLAA